MSPSPPLCILAPEVAPAHTPVNPARLGFSLHHSETHTRLQTSGLSRSGLYFSLPASVFWPYLNDLPLLLASQPNWFFPLAWLLLQGCCFLSCAIALFRQSWLSWFFAPRLCKAVALLLPVVGCLPSAVALIRKADPN